MFIVWVIPYRSHPVYAVRSVESGTKPLLKNIRVVVCRLRSQAIQENQSPKSLGAAYISTQSGAESRTTAAPALLGPPRIVLAQTGSVAKKEVLGAGISTCRVR